MEETDMTVNVAPATDKLSKTEFLEAVAKLIVEWTL
jgi:hypothetical protein